MSMIHTHTHLYICLNDYQSVAFFTMKYNTSDQNNKTSGKMWENLNVMQQQQKQLEQESLEHSYQS